MTTDDQIVADLGIVGRTSRSPSRSLATTLEQLQARIAPRRPEARTATSTVASAVYAARVARIAAGCVLITGVLTLFLIIAFARFNPSDFEKGGFLAAHLDLSSGDVAVHLGAFVALVYVVVWRRALSVRDVHREHVTRLDRWALVVDIAAPLTFLMFFGLSRVVLGNTALLDLIQRDGFDPFAVPLWWPGQMAWSIGALGCVVIVSPIAAIVASRYSTPRRWPAGIAAVTLVATVLVGLQYDRGPVRYAMASFQVANLTLRTVLLVVGGASLLVLTWTLALRRRRREIAALDGK